MLKVILKVQHGIGLLSIRSILQRNKQGNGPLFVQYIFLKQMQFRQGCVYSNAFKQGHVLHQNNPENKNQILQIVVALPTRMR